MIWSQNYVFNPRGMASLPSGIMDYVNSVYDDKFSNLMQIDLQMAVKSATQDNREVVVGQFTVLPGGTITTNSPTGNNVLIQTRPEYAILNVQPVQMSFTSRIESGNATADDLQKYAGSKGVGSQFEKVTEVWTPPVGVDEYSGSNSNLNKVLLGLVLLFVFWKKG